MRQLTASRVWLTAHCLAFLSDSSEWDEKAGPSAQTGNAIHRVIELDGKTGKQADPTSIAVQMALAPYQSKKLHLAYAHWVNWARTQDRSGWQHEIGYSVNPWTGDGRALVMAGPRDYSKAADGDAVGTVDLVDTRDGLAIADWKSGRWVDDPNDSEQLLTLALAASAALGHTGSVRAAIVKVTEEGVTPLWAEYDPMRLAAHRVALAERLDEARAGAMPAPGEHCNKCPARSSCLVSEAKQRKAS